MESPNQLAPARGKLLVRPVETPESLPSGKIVLTAATRKDLTAQQAEVVAVGAPPICDHPPKTPEDVWDCERPKEAHGLEFPDYAVTWWTHPTSAIPGDWVLLAPRCLVETDEPNLYVCSQDDVLAVLEV